MDITAIVAEAATKLRVTIVRELKSGGQKAVVEVSDAQSRAQALLVVRLEGPHAAQVLERARREVQILGRIDNPNVVRVLSELVEIGSPTEAVAWTEELLPGADLRTLVGQQWSWDEAKQLARALSEGLASFHEQNVVHRDLSAGNVMCVAPRVYKIIDPGLARHIGKATMTGLFQPGTPGFMSPEHVRPGARPLPASDVFSAGILLYLALTSRLPVEFRGDFDDYAVRLRQVQMTPLRTLRPDLPDAAIEFINRCLHSQPARRFIDAREMLTAIP